MVAPPEIPVKIPSLLASSLAVAMDSGPETATSSSYKLSAWASSSTLGMKSGVQPCKGQGGGRRLGVKRGLGSKARKSRSMGWV